MAGIACLVHLQDIVALTVEQAVGMGEVVCKQMVGAIVWLVQSPCMDGNLVRGFEVCGGSTQ